MIAPVIRLIILTSSFIRLAEPFRVDRRRESHMQAIGGTIVREQGAEPRRKMAEYDKMPDRVGRLAA